METLETSAVIKCIKFNGYKIDLTTNVKGQPVARLSRFMTMGKNKNQWKHIEGFYFPTEQRREEWVKEKIAAISANIKAETDRKQAKKDVRANMVNPFKVGQIFYDSWGYDQTNIDFYQIVEVKERSVILQEIGASYVPNTQGMDCSNVKPNPSHKVGEPFLKPVVVSIGYNDNKPSYYLKSRHGWISEYTQEEKGVYSSWYH